MARLFRDHPGGIARTLEIVERCRFSLDALAYEYPDQPIPEGTTPDKHLATLAWKGAAHRYPAGVPEKVRTNIAKELALIMQLGYARYFLAVRDIVRHAREKGILCQGRGSAANSVVCFCLGITAVDPTEIDLLSERFISAERREPPDIDVDFEHERREEAIQYIYDRHNRDRAGIAATVIHYRPKLAIRKVGHAMGLPEDATAALSAQSWASGNELWPDARLREIGFDPAEPRLRRTIALARELVGFPRHLSQHVGGFVLTRGKLTETVPVGPAAMPGRSFIEWDKDDIDTLGIMKVDVLALGMLTCIRKCFSLLRQCRMPTGDLAGIPGGRKTLTPTLSRKREKVAGAASRVEGSTSPRSLACSPAPPSSCSPRPTRCCTWTASCNVRPRVSCISSPSGCTIVRRRCADWTLRAPPPPSPAPMRRRIRRCRAIVLCHALATSTDRQGDVRLAVMSYRLRRPAAAVRAPRDEIAGIIAERRFTLALQPVVNVRDRVPDHAEALLRIAVPGSLPPRAFVAAAEAEGLGPALDAAVLDASRTAPAPLSVNICARSLQQRHFVRTVLDAAPAAIELVRLDTLDDLATVAAAVAELRACGVRVMLDAVDGEAAALALAQVARFDALKLAGSVLRAAMAGARGRALLEALLRLAEALGTRPIATQIETFPQLWAAERAGIELVQGWLLSAPTTLPP